MCGVKVVVMGGSGHSTPALFATGVPFGREDFSFTLVGRNRERLAAVGRAIEMISKQACRDVSLRLTLIECLGRALDQADVVVVQIRVGGYTARAWDERFPLAYGLSGDEGLGAGGLAAAWRTWPELQAILSRVATICPTALVILLTSPVGILTRCALDEFPRLHLYGMCELPWTTLLEFYEGDVVGAFGASVSYLGVNHVGWFSNARSIDSAGPTATPLLPLRYVALGQPGYAANQSLQPSRAEQLEIIARSALECYAHGNVATIREALSKRDTPWYSQALAPFLASLAGADLPVSFFLTHRNRGYCEWIDSDAVIEMPYDVRASALERRPLGLWSDERIAGLHSSFVRYEAFAADTVRERERNRIATALKLHPWIDHSAVDDALVEDVLASPGDLTEMIGGRR